MLTAVEPSGDAVGAALVRALRAQLGPGVRFVGVGGPQMAEEGVESPFDPASLAIVGAFNAIAAYPRVRRLVRETAELAQREKPDIAVLIDAWGFSIRVAHALRRIDPSLPLVKYVAPQVWATRPGRARTLARAVDRLLTIHAFDAPYFEAEGLQTTFVGNPVLAEPEAPEPPAAFRARLGLTGEQPILLVLPGSRQGEVRRLMKPFGDAVGRLCDRYPDLVVIVAAADQVAADVERETSLWRSPPIVVAGPALRAAAMGAATAALACSGTVTTELAQAGCPMVVAYRMGPFTNFAAQRLLRTRWITLFNVAAGRFIAPERIQGRCTGAVLAADIARLLDDPERRNRQAREQSAALEIMRGGIGDPAAAAAAAIIDVLEARSAPADQPRASRAV
jgi:lipid-A-disaccharide synthase